MILNKLVCLYNRLERQGEQVPVYGYGLARIGFILEIDPLGHPICMTDSRQKSDKKLFAPLTLVPTVARYRAIQPAFLWDKTSYALGVSAKRRQASSIDQFDVVFGWDSRTAEEHSAFRSSHLNALKSSTDDGLQALRLFLTRWTPEQWIELGFPVDAVDQNIAFRLHGDPQRLDERAAARQ